MRHNDNRPWRQVLGDAGENAVTLELERLGWSVKNLNHQNRNMPNVDLLIAKGNRRVYVRLKAYNNYGWISAGSISQKIADGGPIFNKSQRTCLYADYVVFLSPADPRHKIPTHNHDIPASWRHFVLPVSEAERLFHIHVDSIMAKPKTDGSRRSATGAIQDWVGPGLKTAPWGPDLSHEYGKYEGRFALLSGT